MFLRLSGNALAVYAARGVAVTLLWCERVTVSQKSKMRHLLTRVVVHVADSNVTEVIIVSHKSRLR